MSDLEVKVDKKGRKKISRDDFRGGRKLMAYAKAVITKNDVEIATIQPGMFVYTIPYDMANDSYDECVKQLPKAPVFYVREIFSIVDDADPVTGQHMGVLRCLTYEEFCEQNTIHADPRIAPTDLVVSKLPDYVSLDSVLAPMPALREPGLPTPGFDGPRRVSYTTTNTDKNLQRMDAKTQLVLEPLFDAHDVFVPNNDVKHLVDVKLLGLLDTVDGSGGSDDGDVSWDAKSSKKRSAGGGSKPLAKRRRKKIVVKPEAIWHRFKWEAPHNETDSSSSIEILAIVASGAAQLPPSSPDGPLPPRSPDDDDGPLTPTPPRTPEPELQETILREGPPPSEARTPPSPTPPVMMRERPQSPFEEWSSPLPSPQLSPRPKKAKQTLAPLPPLAPLAPKDPLALLSLLPLMPPLARKDLLAQKMVSKKTLAQKKTPALIQAPTQAPAPKVASPKKSAATDASPKSPGKNLTAKQALQKQISVDATQDTVIASGTAMPKEALAPKEGSVPKEKQTPIRSTASLVLESIMSGPQTLKLRAPAKAMAPAHSQDETADRLGDDGQWRHYKPELAKYINQLLVEQNNLSEAQFRSYASPLDWPKMPFVLKNLGGEFGKFVVDVVLANTEGAAAFARRFNADWIRHAYAPFLRYETYKYLALLMDTDVYGAPPLTPAIELRAVELRAAARANGQA